MQHIQFKFREGTEIRHQVKANLFRFSLVQRLQQMDYPLADLTLRDVSAYDLVSIDNDDSPIALLYQSGYLTIKGYDSTMDSYSLDFPNREVSEGFTKFIYPYYTPRPLYRAPFSVRHFLNDILSGNAEGFVQRLQALFADGDYRIVGNREIYFQNTLYVFFKLLGFYVDVERPTSSGRMDALIKTGQHVYIIEIKVDQSAAVALQQIEERQYAAPFAADARRVHKIGINFNSQTRKIDEYLIV